MATKQIQPIETEYHGYRFRSRLEARWAIYFDAVGLLWEYEREGYRLASGPYLPDFWLSTVSMWAEVKAVQFTLPELKLAVELADMTRYPVYLLAGTPAARAYPVCMPGGNDLINHEVCQYKNEGRPWASYAADDLYQPDLLQQAANAARAARFEHGERP